MILSEAEYQTFDRFTSQQRRGVSPPPKLWRHHGF